MISLASLPLYRQYGGKWLMEKGHITVRIDGSEVLVRPRSYDLYVLGEVFREQVYTPTLRPQLFPRVIADLGAHIGAFHIVGSRQMEGRETHRRRNGSREFRAIAEEHSPQSPRWKGVGNSRSRLGFTQSRDYKPPRLQPRNA